MSVFEEIRLKFTSTEPLKYGANAAAEFDDPCWPRFVRITDVDANGQLRDDTFRSLPPEVAEPFLLQAGDILLARSGATVGKSFIYDASWGDACYAGYLIRLRTSTSYFSKYIYWCLQSSKYWADIEANLIQSTIQNVSAERYASFRLPSPHLKTQQRIAQFLDKKAAQIDGLIEKKRTLLDRLAEKRQALITRAVTKGLNPKAPMKPSGIDWLGDIPAHWEVKELRFISTRIKTGPFGAQLNSAEFVDDETPVLNPTELVGGSIKPNRHCTVVRETAERLTDYRLSKGDIIFARRGEMGRCALVTENEAGWICGTGSLLVSPNKEIVHSDFLLAYLGSEFSKAWFSLNSVGATMPNLNEIILGKFPITLPPFEEQVRLTEMLGRESGLVSRDIQKVTQSISLLDEYRSALITAAVTGQLEVA